LADAEAHGATDEPPHAPPPDLPPLEKLSRGQWITAWLYVCVLSGVYSQQNLLAPNLTAIQLEFGFTPAERDKKLGGARAARPAPARLRSRLWPLPRPWGARAPCAGDPHGKDMQPWSQARAQPACPLPRA
jgi:hypothetical protein